MSTTREPYRAWQLPPQDKPGAGGETSASGKSGEPGLDVTRPHPARIYNYLLDGTEHFAADREAAEQIIAASPGARPSARGNRVFLRRAVRYLVRRGVRQFLDIGTGIPTVGNSHEVAQELAPDARVVYADNYPIVLALDYAPSLMRSSVAGRTAYIQADVRDPKSILSDPQVRAVIDFDLPVAVLLVAVLHFVRDEEDPAALVAELRDALAPGSHVVVSHVSGDFDPERARTAAQVYTRATAPAVLRTWHEIRALLAGFELVAPGLVALPRWDPDGDPDDGSFGTFDDRLVWLYGGVGRKR